MATDSEIVECFRPWFRVSTWNTIHPADDKRFYKCCFDAFQRRELEINADDFREELIEVIAETHGSSIKAVERDIERFASKIETIREYLFDTGQLGSAM